MFHANNIELDNRCLKSKFQFLNPDRIPPRSFSALTVFVVAPASRRGSDRVGPTHLEAPNFARGMKMITAADVVLLRKLSVAVKWSP